MLNAKEGELLKNNYYYTWCDGLNTVIYELSLHPTECAMGGPPPGGALLPTVGGTIVQSIVVGGGVGVDVEGKGHCLDVVAACIISEFILFRSHSIRNSRESYYTAYMSVRECCSGYRDVRGQCKRKFIRYS